MKLIEITGDSPGYKQELVPHSNKQIANDFIIETLQKHCHEVLSVYKNTVDLFDKNLPRIMWRGEGTRVQFYKNSIWKKREPLFLKSVIHDASVSAFHKLGLLCNRENSIFCATPDVASDWGSEIYGIFPVDGFHVTWFSKKLPNSYRYMYDILENSLDIFADEIVAKAYPDDRKKQAVEYDKIVHNIKDDKHLFSEYVDYVALLLDKYKPINDRLQDALKTKHLTEFLVSGAAYYGVKVTVFNDEFNKKLFS